MHLFSVKDLTKSHGGLPLFSDITFGLDAGEKVAFIGANGTGKSTLFRILAGREEPDAGQVLRRNSLKTAYLPQIPLFDPEATVRDHILNGRHGTNHREGREPEYRIEMVLQQLGIEDLDARMGILSGGMVRKVELARALLGEHDLLMLDEPTNHLDLQSIEWLQDVLANTGSAVALVTHDRYFLEAVCTKIYELDNRTLYAYDGNYSTYLEKRAERIETEARRQEKIDSILRRELEWLKRGPKARTSKDRKRKERITNLQDSVERAEEERMEFSTGARRLGKKILEVKHLSKSFDGRRILADFSYSFEKGSRIGIVGPNGSGKTTFIRLLTGRLEPDGGEIEAGTNTRFGYFDQLSETMDPEQTVSGYLSEYADEIKRAGGVTVSVSQLLEDFKFPPERQYARIGTLSGGERRRLYLLKILLPAPNFLVFDEPTNDLDINTLSLLENFLSEYDGCLVSVSHDRYFLDRTADFLFVFDGTGTVSVYPGSYTEYAEQRKQEERRQKREERKEKEDTRRRTEPEKRRLSFKEQREFESLMHGVEALETEKASLEAYFASPESDPSAMERNRKRYDRVCSEIEEKTARWEELAERAE